MEIVSSLVNSCMKENRNASMNKMSFGVYPSGLMVKLSIVHDASAFNAVCGLSNLTAVCAA